MTTRPMVYGVKLTGLIPKYAPNIAGLPDFVVELERIGYDEVVHGEHILWGEKMKHPGVDAPHGRVTRSSNISDVMVLFGAIASRTRRIRMCAGALLPALHQPPLLAKQAATLDHLSDGRFELAVAGGWFEAEYAALGVPFEERFGRMEEAVAVCRALWNEAQATFHGKWTHFDRMLLEPAPVTPGGPLVWWGGKGTAPATVRRVIELGAGWAASEGATYEEVVAANDSLTEACAAAGRDRSTVSIRASLPSRREDVERMASVSDCIDYLVAGRDRLAAAGVTHFTLPLAAFDFDPDALTEVLDALRRG